MATAQQTLSLADSYMGYHESPAGSNRTQFGIDFGWSGVAWCAIFVWDICTKSSVDLPVKTASVYVLMAAFKRAGAFYSQPQVGDIVIYGFGQGHTGFVESFTPTTITSVEGNTSAADGLNTNGGEVARHTRPRNGSILGYCRPSYTSQPSSSPVPLLAPSETDMTVERTITYPLRVKVS